MRCAVDTGEPGLPVVRPEGSLTLDTSTELRQTLVKCLADQPEAVVVDLRALAIVDDLAATVFSAVARDAAAWPGVPIVLCADAPVLEVLRRIAIDRQAVLRADLGSARAYARSCPAPRQVREWFPTSAEAVGDARRYVAGACRTWHLSALSPVAELVTSELVSNAVRYGGGTVLEVVLTRQPRYLCLAVRDASRYPPRCTGPDGESAVHGRGLLIVDAYASTWGFTPTRDGKVTWATLAISGRTAP